MKKIGDNEIKLIEQELLQHFHKICENEGLNYSLIGGSLLGAVRHKGFIPWDDDIDVAMPRQDYNRFINYCVKNDTPFTLLSHENNSNYKKLFSKIYDKRTQIADENDNRWNFDCGIHIDVFPIDGLGKSEKEAVRVIRKIRFCFELLVASQWKQYRRSRTHKSYWEIFRFTFYVLSRFVNADRLIEKIEKQITSQAYKDCKYLAIVSGSYRFKEIMPRYVYEDYCLLEFEHECYYAISNYDIYLKKIYGNYMQLPPIEKQVSHHTFEAYWREE